MLCFDRLRSSAGRTYRLATTQELVSLVIKCRWTLLASNEDSPHVQNVTECSVPFLFLLKKTECNFFSLFAYFHFLFLNAHINHTYKELWKENQVYKRSSTCIHNIANNVFFLRGQCKAHGIYVHSQLRASGKERDQKMKEKEDWGVRRQPMVPQIECSWMGWVEGSEGE